MTKIIERKKYSTDTATLIADNEFRDGANRLQGGRGSSLYRTPNGAYFFHHETQWIGEHDRIEPIDGTHDAEQFFASAYNQEMDFATAFPTVTVAEA